MGYRFLRLASVLVSIVVLAPSRFPVECLMCDRTPPTATVPKTPGDGGFKITVNGNTHINTYVPGAVYTVRIEGPADQYRVEKFSGFLLVAESADGIGHSSRDSAGTFKQKDDSLVRFSEFCPDAVKQSSEVAKSEIQVLWTAPSLPARCVNFRATVVKNAQSWYMDDEQLTKRLCAENSDVTDEGDHSGPCRACEEAKYEMTFEGLWSSLTHPKDFPSNEWKPQFKDLIGASHSRNYRIWEDEGIASEGLRHIAERDDPKYLEAELKEQSANIRTIIKARGIEHTNVQGLKTYAIFRADREHNLISFVSRIDPSPDWFVGVSGLNLCTRNGSWVPERTVQLFPWDAGTDNGVRYLDRDMPTMPRHRIRQIVWSNDKNSPFFDADGNMIKPFATLHIQQLRSYKRSTCDQYHGGESGEYGEDEFEDDDAERPECEMHPWSAYTACSVSCGQGIQRKYRSYTNPRLARDHGCNRTESKEIFCYNAHGCEQQPTGMSPYDNVDNTHTFGGGGSIYGQTSPMEQFGNTGYTDSQTAYGGSPGFGGISSHHNNDPTGEDPCAVSEWTPWSICADPCGKGIRYQSRTFKNPKQAAMYGCETSVSLRSKERCPVTPECRETSVTSTITDITSNAVADPDCEVSRWRDWTPCSVTCGIGSRTRSRVYRYHGVDHSKCKLEMIVIEPCQGLVPTCEAERNRGDCYEPKDEGECRNNFNITRWYFDTSKMKCFQFLWNGCSNSKNNFESREDCESLCGSLRETIRTRHSSNRAVGGVGTADSNWYQSMSPSGGQHYQPNIMTEGRFYSPVTQQPPTYTRFSTMAPPANQWIPSSIQQQYQYGQTYSQPQVTRFQSTTSRQSHRLSPSNMYGDGPPIDCKMSPWSSWSKCSVSCGRGFKYQTRYVQIYDQNGGKSCPTLLERTRSCKGEKCLTSRTSKKRTSPLPLDDYVL